MTETNNSVLRATVICSPAAMVISGFVPHETQVNLNLKGRLSTLYIPRLSSQPNYRGLYRAIGNAYVQGIMVGQIFEQPKLFTQMYSLLKTVLRRI
jgi:hypothetical protein